jgi:HAD superfamily hydrolase (TIGR01509 family)
VGCTKTECKKRIRQYYGEIFDYDRAYAVRTNYVRSVTDKDGIKVKKCVESMLDVLDALGIKKCVATSTSRERATQKLADANLAHRFEIIIGGDDIVNGKPAPDIFLKAAASCNTPLQDCIIIEDTEAGILGANAANIRVIVVPDIAPLNEKIRARADFICTDLFEVAKMFL